LDSEAELIKKQTLLGRVYFLAAIPFLGAVLAPWILGPEGNNQGPSFVLWSFTVLIFSSAVSLGYSLGQNQKWLYLNGFIALLFAGLGLGCVLLAFTAPQFAAVALLTVLHRFNWVWLQKSQALSAEFFKLHNRFVWTLLVCHMLVMLNLIYAVRSAAVS
jgi:hypothetical protein